MWDRANKNSNCLFSKRQQAKQRWAAGEFNSTNGAHFRSFFVLLMCYKVMYINETLIYIHNLSPPTPASYFNEVSLRSKLQQFWAVVAESWIVVVEMKYLLFLAVELFTPRFCAASVVLWHVSACLLSLHVSVKALIRTHHYIFYLPPTQPWFIMLVKLSACC